MKWGIVCKPKKLDGLGIRDCKSNNLAMLAKVGWNLYNGKKFSWTTILKEKYKVSSNPRSWKKKVNYFHLLRGVMKTKKILQKNIKWNIGNGKSISIEKDWWCGNDSFANINLFTSDTELNKKVDFIFKENGGRDVNKISTLLPSTVHEEILKTSPSIDLTKEDKPF